MSRVFPRSLSSWLARPLAACVLACAGLVAAHTTTSDGQYRVQPVAERPSHDALGLVLRRRFAEATFAIAATAGSGLLNLAAKQGFRRERPA